MRAYVCGQVAASIEEFMELALGTPPELWLGVEGESSEDRTARLAAARDILADDPELVDRVSAVAARAIEEHTPELFTVRQLPARPASRGARKAVA
ncbi:hypothetical protein [Streptomyces cinnamoneus]|uniref:Uncharacterized protein n=1 Tax=Streptomyces cinnamoneus TaxID=53446 RepID=A0A918T9K3_STRCJ|nr:hypothetical protein [Streptomyces cinnamoneus]GHC33085.1 hypothetical protein GCM10010507_01810 [Streptomyces cinnamoneus]